MSNILIYYSSNKPSNVIETIAKGFVDRGHNVYLLTQTPKGDLHGNFEKIGIETFSYDIKKISSLVYFISHIRFLIVFCKKHQIHAVQSHLQQANIIAVFTQYFIKAKVVLCRHHLIEPSKMSHYFDKVCNALGKIIVVPSLVIKSRMLEHEHVKKVKVKLVPYVYNFDNYPKPNLEEVYHIKQQYECRLLVLLCGRFVPLKRNELAFQAINELIKDGYDIKLLALDEGPGLEEIKQYVKNEKLQDRTYFLGFKKNIMDYISACHVLVHPSYTEASNNTVKEAALYSKSVIVCEGVGDFSEYIIHGKNGYLVNREHPLKDIINCLKTIYGNVNDTNVGDKLKQTVYEKFNNSNEIIKTHLNLLGLS